ncbi:MAG: hypothetical protein WBG69_09325 [Arcobacteraceae bacterium]
MKFLYINFLMFILPSIYIIFNFTNAKELSCGLTMFIGGLGLIYLDKNMDKPEVMEFIRRYI